MIDVEGAVGDGGRGGLRRGPHPRQVDPQLAVRDETGIGGPGWIHERKLDGVRLLVHLDGGDVRLITRTGLDRVRTFPELPPAIGRLGATDLVADGEVVALDEGATSFGRLQRRLGRTLPAHATPEPPVHLYLFDLLHLEGYDLRGLGLLTRKRLLAALTFTEPVRYTEHRDDDVRDHLADACRAGWEGLIAKRADEPYRSGRGPAWRKLLCSRTGRFVVGGWTDPRGTRAGLGALLLGRRDAAGLHYAGRVGTGMDDRTLDVLAAHLARAEQTRPPFLDPPREPSVHWAVPHLVVEVRFAGWTEAGRLRHPALVGIRPDVDPSQAVGEGA